MEKLHRWIAQVAKGASWRAIADELETTHSTIQRRLSSSTATTIIEIADSYDVNPLPGLLAAGLVSQWQIDQCARAATLDDFSDLDLAREIVRRLEQAENSETDHPHLHATTFTDEQLLRAVADSSDDPADEIDIDYP